MLAGAEESATGMQTGAYNTAANTAGAAAQLEAGGLKDYMNIYGGAQAAQAQSLYGANMDLASMYGGARERATTGVAEATGKIAQANYNAGADYAGAVMNAAQNKAGAYNYRAAGTQQYNQALDTSSLQRTSLAGQGMLINAEAKDQAYLNSMNEFGNKMNYYTQAAQQYDPFNAGLEVSGNKAGMQYSYLSNYYNQDAAKKAMWSGIVGQTVSGILNPIGNMMGGSSNPTYGAGGAGGATAGQFAGTAAQQVAGQNVGYNMQYVPWSVF